MHQSQLELQLPDLQVGRLRIPSGVAVAGRTLAETELRQRYGVTVLAVCRGTYSIPNPDGDVRLLPGDELILIGPPERLDDAAEVIREA